MAPNFDEIDPFRRPFAELGASALAGVAAPAFIPPRVVLVGLLFGDVVLKSGVSGFTMTDDGDKREAPNGAAATISGKGAKQARRQDRLKQALRDNLKRRKSQSRGRDDLISAPSNIDDASPYDGGSGKSDE